MNTVLISGAGVAGLTLAHWLSRHGFVPTVVERATASRLAGQAIDVRGPALDVVERMGILPAVREARTQMRGMSLVDGDGVEIENRTDYTFSTGRLENEDVELLREDLTRLLLEQAGDGVEFIYGDSITSLVEEKRGVRVGFERAAPRTFDLVIGADGLHSKVREVAFGTEDRFVHHLGSYLSVCTAENFLDLDNWQVWHRGESAGYGVYPVHGNTQLRITFSFDSEPLDFDRRDTAGQKALVLDRIGHLRGHAPRMAQALRESSDFYFDAMAQVRMAPWSRGRVALLGDAAHCASPLAGQGTSLALVGAYVLAQELRVADDHATAFTRYELRMRSFVEQNQALALGDPEDPKFVEETFEKAKNAISLDG